MSTKYLCPTNGKASFTFGNSLEHGTLAPGHGASSRQGGGVSSVLFAAPPYANRAAANTLVHCNGKIVLKVRQLPRTSSSNCTTSLEPGALKRMRETSKDDSLTLSYNTPLMCKRSDSQDTPADVVAVIDVPRVAASAKASAEA